MSGQVLALVVRTERNYPGGDFVDYDVCDSRTGEVLATRSCLPSANEVATFLNSTYPLGSNLSGDQICTAPAHDTLVHEIVGWRQRGQAAVPLNRWWAEHIPQCCPDRVPTGPGWDHIYEEVQR